MTTFNVVGRWSSGNVDFIDSSGNDIVYLDGTNKQVVAAKQTVTGSLIASSSASVAGGQTVSGSLVASSSFAATGNATISASLLASSSAAISGQLTATKKVIGSSDASFAGTVTLGSTATLTIPINVFNCPEIRGRSDYNFTAAGSTNGGGVVLSATNPLNVDLWVERVYVNVQTASSSSAYWYCGTANTASSSQSTLWATGLACTTGGLAGNSTEITRPVVWESTGFFTGCVGSCSDGSAGLVGTVSVFYILPVTT